MSRTIPTRTAERSARARAQARLRIEVFQHLFAATAEEMGATLLRSSFSPNIKERRDFSCALFDAQGRTISQAAHIPIHLGSVPLCVAAAMREVAMGPGDAVVLNDPYRGGTHLPDITLVTPVFLGGGRAPEFYCANRAHHADVGGSRPGSMAPESDVHAEGTRIPPILLVRGGRIRRDVLALLLSNMRVPREREGDLLAQWSANRLGARRLAELAREHTRRELVERAADLLDWTERVTAQLFASFPRGRFTFEDRLEVPGSSSGAAIRVGVEARDGELEIDFRASDDQVGHGLNATRAVAVSAAFYVVRLLLPASTPTNDGILRRMRVLTREGSLVDARYPAPVAAGNVETSQRLVDAVLGALAQAWPDRIPAASAGTMSNLAFGGVRANGEAFSYYETLAGGAGASSAGPGADAVHTHMTNTRNTPIEAFESALPARVLACTVRRGSGGAGIHRGGDGLSKRTRFLVPVELSWIADRAERGPWGLAGGQSGATGAASVHTSGASRALASKSATSLEAGAELEVETPGGGGWGAPSARDAR